MFPIKSKFCPKVLLIMRILIILFLQFVVSINDTDPNAWKGLDAFKLPDDVKPQLNTVRSNNAFNWS